MKRLSISLPDHVHELIEKKALSMGFSISKYITEIAKESLDKQHAIVPISPDLTLFSKNIEALVGVFAEGLGRSQGRSDDLILKMKDLLLDVYRKSQKA